MQSKKEASRDLKYKPGYMAIRINDSHKLLNLRGFLSSLILKYSDRIFILKPVCPAVSESMWWSGHRGVDFGEVDEILVSFVRRFENPQFSKFRFINKFRDKTFTKIFRYRVIECWVPLKLRELEK